MEEDRITESVRNISDKWMNSIYDSLQRLEEYERMAREGFKGLMEYVQSIGTLNKNIEIIMFQNLKFLVSEMKILIPKAKFHLKEEEFKTLTENVGEYGRIIQKGYMIINKKKQEIFTKGSDYKHRQIFKLGNGFDLLFELVINTKNRILDDLDNIVFQGKQEIEQRES